MEPLGVSVPLWTTFGRVSTYGGMLHHVSVFVQRILDDHRVDYVLPWGSKLTE